MDFITSVEESKFLFAAGKDIYTARWYWERSIFADRPWHLHRVPFAEKQLHL